MYSGRYGKTTVAYGIEFRSELEASVAGFFKAWGQRFIYEPKIKTSDGHFLGYQVDFFLPDARLFVEVKPMNLRRELQKMQAMVNHFDFVDYGFCAVMENSELLTVWDPPMKGMFLDRFEHRWDCPESFGWNTVGGGKIQNTLFWGQCQNCKSLIACGGGCWACMGCGWHGGDACMVSELSYNVFH
jgi:hypothetical protein